MENELSNNNINPFPNDPNYLLKLYIGKSYDNIINNKYNLFVLIFGPFMLFYKGMITEGIFIVFFQVIFALFLPFYIWIILYILLNIFLSFIYNEAYLKDAIYKVNKLCAKYNDNIVSHVKRNSLFSMFITIIFLFIYIFLIFISLMNTKQSAFAGNMSFMYQDTCSFDNNNTVISNSKECFMSFYYTQVLDKYSLIKDSGFNYNKYNLVEYNNIKWEKYISNTFTMYVYVNYNEIYYIKTNNDGNCKKMYDDILNTIVVESSEYNE